jgi:erythromycin esterase-like protein
VGLDYAPPRATREFLRHAFEGQGAVPPELLSSLEPLHRIVSWLETPKLSPAERDALLRAVQELERVAESPAPGALLTMQGLQITQRILEARGRDVDEFRDRVMAEAVLALLSRSDKPRRIAIWAHNGHLAQGPIEGAVPMGHYLRQRLAEKYRAIGSMFYEGSFRTYGGLQEKMVNHAVALPPPFYLESVMHRVSPSGACALDVVEATRRAQVRDWIAVPKHVRIYGGLEISESYPWPPVIVPDLWSAMIFVPSTAPTTPLE